MSSIYEMKRTISDAQDTLNHADSVACEIAPLLRGRLRHCYESDLIALKKELKHFNMHTREWKS